MWLLSLQGRGLAVQVPHDLGESNFISVKFFHVYRTTQYCAGDKIENNEMGWACGTYG